jgi:WD40 repeat protein
MVLSASADESVRLWNVVTGLLLAVFSGDHGHSCEVLRVSWSTYYPDLFASSGVDSSVRIWGLHQVCCFRVQHSPEDAHRLHRKLAHVHRSIH